MSWVQQDLPFLLLLLTSRKESPKQKLSNFLYKEFGLCSSLLYLVFTRSHKDNYSAIAFAAYSGMDGYLLVFHNGSAWVIETNNYPQFRFSNNKFLLTIESVKTSAFICSSHTVCRFYSRLGDLEKRPTRVQVVLPGSNDSFLTVAPLPSKVFIIHISFTN